jgi:hypothetical protein
MNPRRHKRAKRRASLSSGFFGSWKEVPLPARGWAYRLFKNSGSRRWCDGCARDGFVVLVRASTPWVMYCIVRPIFKRVGRATSAYENSLWLWGLRRQGEIAEL